MSWTPRALQAAGCVEAASEIILLAPISVIYKWVEDLPALAKLLPPPTPLEQPKHRMRLLKSQLISFHLLAHFWMYWPQTSPKGPLFSEGELRQGSQGAL